LESYRYYDVTQLGQHTGNPVVFDENYKSGEYVYKSANNEYIVTFDKKVSMGKAVTTAQSSRSGTTYLYLHMTFYWSDDGITWTKAGGSTQVPHNVNGTATVTTTVTN
jgi:hypothetical protein